MTLQEQKTNVETATAVADTNIEQNSPVSPAELLKSSILKLEKQGGFQLLKGLVKGLENMDPRHKAVKNIFLSDSAYAASRKQLKDELAIWIDILENGGTDAMAIIDTCKGKCSKAELNLKENLFTVHDELRALEVTYRTLESFFSNAGEGKIECITLKNVNKSELKDKNSDDYQAVKAELEQYYDRLSLKNNYSLMVIPGYLGNASNVRMWADTAYHNKVLLITDFKDSQSFQMLKDELDDASVQGQDLCLSNAVMTCNYLLGRKKSELAGEDDDMYIPASASLAGKMSNTDDIIIAQGAAGKKYGTLCGTNGARLNLRKSEIASLIDDGVIPMVEEDGRTMAFSNRSLYNGGTIGLQEYPIVRVFDWIGKVFQNFFNDEAFINWNSSVKAELQQTIHDFLSDYKGPGKLIENYNLKGINQDPHTKDISIQVEIKPFFAAKNFYIELTGHNSKGSVDWDTQIK